MPALQLQIHARFAASYSAHTLRAMRMPSSMAGAPA
jgi:hypothetical protein